MITVTHESEPVDVEVCACCGHPIRRVVNPASLMLFLESNTLQRRSFQCMNCGRVVCHRCGTSSSCCICGSNAWIAIPCLRRMPAAVQTVPGN